MEKRDFMERMILERGVTPESALATWTDLQQELLKDWKLGTVTDPGSFLSRLIDGFDVLSESQRRTVFALLRERYVEWSGERQERRRW